jgi:hypothetical protein
MSLLGNSVVPQCVKLAFEMCAHQILSAKNPADACGMHVYEWGAWDADQDHVFGFVKPEFPAPPSCNLVMNSNFFTFLEEDGTVATTENCTSGVITKDWTTTRWATPRTGCRVPARHFTFRSRTDLPSQLRFERETPDEDRGGYVNAVFVEWLMGYPVDFTDCSRPPRSGVLSNSPPREKR